ncbi:MAG: BamA/TamA family outer membrane protein [Bacteroidetes bacterium]|nr:BamA/TamA family outer membrane protein [Bacteroidota bacterium]
MSGKHFKKYLQKYYIFGSFASIIFFLCACNVTKKVPPGEFLLTKNDLEYKDGSIFSTDLESAILQKPNKKALLLFPLTLTMYNMTNPKYDTILAEYMAFPTQMRNQKLRDSLFIKNGHPEWVGQSLFWNRNLYSYGKPPVILEEDKTAKTTVVLQKKLRNHGYWDAKVNYAIKRDTTNKKAQVQYEVTHKDPTYINDYYYSIADENIKKLYERDFNKSFVKKGDILDHSELEKEAKRISDNMKNEGYYKFNASTDEIYFVTDSLKDRKHVPLTLYIKKDSANTPYKIAKIGKIDVAVVENANDFPSKTKKDSLLGINFHKIDNQFRNNALWRAITLKSGDRYDQNMLDLTKRNLLNMNNFSIIKAKDSLRNDGLGSPGNDGIIDVLYLLKPLDKFERKIMLDANYSQLLSYAISPSIDLTTRNVFGGMENLNTSVTGVFGRIVDPADPSSRILAYEFSAQANLTIPRLLLPFKYYKVIPKRFSPSSSINLGMSYQKNIGMDRIMFNGGLNYYANVNDRVVHKLTLFNTLLSITQNKDKYYDYYVNENQIRLQVFNNYFQYLPYIGTLYSNGTLTMDQVSAMIFEDQTYQNTLTTDDQINLINSFKQSLINKDRLTQNVLISSVLYDFTYNEMGKSEYQNPFYFNAKVEVAGNILSMLKHSSSEQGVTNNDQKTIFNIPYSQFIKFDFDIRKFFTFRDGKNTLALRQFVGIGIPYGNSNAMPFVRSYFNGGSNDIRAWLPFGGLGPADSQLNEAVRTYIMDNVKLTTSIEYRVPFNSTYEGALFTDIGNTWSLKDNGLGDEFKFSKFYKQVGIGSGFGLRLKIAYIVFRLDLAYKIYDPNQPEGQRWRIDKIQPLKPTLNIAFFYPF